MSRESKRTGAPAGCGPALLVVLGLLLPSAAAGQVFCTDEMTFEQCYDAHFRQLSPEVADQREALQNQPAELGEMSTGVGAAGFSSAISDFLPILAGSLGLNPVDGGEENAMAFETNFALPAGAGPHQRVRFRATLHKARLSETLRTALPENLRDGRAQAIEEDFSSFDDIELGVAWNLERDGVGRSFRSHQELFGRLIGSTPESGLGFAVAITDFIVANNAAVGACATMVCLNAGLRSELSTLLARLAMTDVQALETDRRNVELSGLDRFAALVNNQPQFSVEADLRHRESDLIGPEMFGVRARYEFGAGNINGLGSFCGGGADDITLECYTRYVADPDVKKALDNGDRFFVSARFGWTSRYEGALPEDMVMVTVPSIWEVTFNLGYGRYLGVDADGKERGRLDIAFEGRRVEKGNVLTENRIVLRADLSSRVSDGVTLVFGISAANKSEFIGEKGNKFRVSTGLRYGVS